MERYDVAVIGAGPEGLIAAALLARAGASVIVLEKNEAPGGRATTREFHPGFRASPFTDELPAIPQRLFWSLDLARRGALLRYAPASVCVSANGTSVLYADDERLARSLSSFVGPGLVALSREIGAWQTSLAEHSATPAPPPSRLRFWRRPHSPPWPGEELGQHSLADALTARVNDAQLRLHLAADALLGRSASPFLAGTALHLLAAGRSGVALGGLGTLGDAFTRVAEAAGATIRCNAEVNDVHLVRSALGLRRATGVVVGTEEIMVRAVLSTLDAKRGFLSLFDWKGLPQKLVKQAAQFRARGQAARVLFALDEPPSFSFAREMPDTARGPIHIVPSLEAMSQAHDSWRAGAMPEQPHITLRVPSLSDPRLAPPGKAAMTATLGAIPAHLFDGPWTPDKRALLVKAALAAAETAAPGVSGRVLASHVIAAPDIEAALGLTDGDLDGGELTPDQALSFRPWPGMEGGRTAVAGFYLAGPSAAPSPFLTGASGQRAALTLLADLKTGRLP
jgi:phytoene dehydrogenase-like protein